MVNETVFKFCKVFNFIFILGRQNMPTCSFTFLITKSFRSPAEHMCSWLYHLYSCPFFQDNWPTGPIKNCFHVCFYRHNRIPGLLLVCSEDLQCGQSRLEDLQCGPSGLEKTLHKKDFLCLTNIYLFPLPAISIFLNSQDFLSFLSPISPGSWDPGTWSWSWDLAPWSLHSDVHWSPEPGARYLEPGIWDPIKHFLRNIVPAPLSCPVIVR